MYGFASASSSSVANASRRSAIEALSIAEIVHENDGAGTAEQPAPVAA